MSFGIKSMALIVALGTTATACATVASETPSEIVREAGDVFVTANLTAAGEASGISGMVRVIDLPGTDDIQVQVEGTGVTPGLHAWHIHSGTCAQPGGVVVPFTPTRQMAGIDEDIEAEADGEIEESSVVTSAMLSRQQIESGTYSLNIHASGGVDHGPRIACADL